MYHILWAIGGWEQCWDYLDEEVIGGGLKTDNEPFATVGEAVAMAADPEQLALWQERHGPGAAVVLDSKGNRIAGPFSPPAPAECHKILSGILTTSWRPRAEAPRDNWTAYLAALMAHPN